MLTEVARLPLFSRLNEAIAQLRGPNLCLQRWRQHPPCIFSGDRKIGGRELSVCAFRRSQPNSGQAVGNGFFDLDVWDDSRIGKRLKAVANNLSAGCRTTGGYRVGHAEVGQRLTIDHDRDAIAVGSDIEREHRGQRDKRKRDRQRKAQDSAHDEPSEFAILPGFFSKAKSIAVLGVHERLPEFSVFLASV